ncbi:MAG: hypothetical protein M3463_12180 [Verrucomicrobiota bacterium]|nr:hypothetical protein [Verrucomicrobiota bacterium]
MMGIIVIIMALLAPALTGIRAASGVTKAAYEISGILEQARTYAMANHTYVLAGIAEVDAAQPESARPQVPGVGRVAVVTVASRDGTRGHDLANAQASWQASYANGANLLPLGKLAVFENIHLAETLGKPPETGPMARYTATGRNLIGSASSKSATPFTWPLGSPLGSGGGEYDFEKVITFDPQGVARVQYGQGHGMVEWLEIDLQQTRENVLPAAPDDPNPGNHVAIMINGLTGAIRLFRP